VRSSKLEARQARRDIERLLDWDGAIRKNRHALDRFLAHENPRVRVYAEQVVRDDEEIRKLGDEDSG
jgi:hypothetical protein